MELNKPDAIVKKAADFPVRLSDISESGIGIYTTRTMYDGMIFDVVLNGFTCRARVVRQFAGNGASRKEVGVGMQFCHDGFANNGDGKGADGLLQLVRALPKPESLSFWPDGHEQRRHPRKAFEGEAILRETCPQVINDDFCLFHHGLTCHVDQYVPMFREIEVTISCKERLGDCLFRGVVIRCEKIHDNNYCLEIFCPKPERDSYNIITFN